jgi:sulfur relay (sulfurtransferase) DsrC/TusE family protein
MAKIDLEGIAQQAQGKDFSQFADNFKTAIVNLGARDKFGKISTDEDYETDEDGYVIGDIWSEKIASELMDRNGFQATVPRIDILIEAREIFGLRSVPTDHDVVAKTMGVSSANFLKMFPKFPIIYFTRWGNLRKPFDLAKLRENPVKN